MKRTHAVVLSAAAAATAITLGASALHAQVIGTTTNPMGSLVQAIASKFNLNQSDVQKVFDDQRAQMEAQMQAKRAAEQKTRLDQAVKDSKITQAQEDLIIAKQAESRTFMDSLKGKTEAERQSAMKAQADALKAWAQQNNIPEQFIGFGFGHGPMDGHMGKPFGDPRVQLDQAVKDGKITQAQADQLTAKLTEMKTAMVALKDKAPEERQAAMKAQMDAFKSWAEQNKIPTSLIQPLGGRGMHGAPGRGFGGPGMMPMGAPAGN